MKIGRVAILKEVEEWMIPDEFTLEMRGNDSSSVLTYTEYYRTNDEARFRFISEATKKDLESGGPVVEGIEFKDGVGKITVRTEGSRAQLLEGLFREILLQLQFYYEPNAIREFFDYVKVYESREEG